MSVSWLWLTNDLVQRVSGVLGAVALTPEGIPVASSQDLTHQDADHLAAVTAGVQSLGRALALQLPTGAPRRALIEGENATLVVTPSGDGVYLAVLVNAGTNVARVIHEIAALVDAATTPTAPARTR